MAFKGEIYMIDKINNLKKKIFFKRFKILFVKALDDGKITKFDNEIYTKMNDTIIACLPVSLHIKYSNYLFPDHTCYDRSIYMFLALDDALLVRGKTKSLEYRYCSEESGHGWVEIGNFVYDPSLMLKFDKNIYYSLYWCSDVTKTDKKTYLSQHKEFFDSYVSHDIDDFKPGGKRRLDLSLLSIQLKIFPDLFLVNLVFSFITFLMYFTIENPDMKLVEELISKNESIREIKVDVQDTTAPGFSTEIKNYNVYENGTCRMELGNLIGKDSYQTQTKLLECYGIKTTGATPTYNFEDNALDAMGGLNVKLYILSKETNQWVALSDGYIPNRSGLYAILVVISDNAGVGQNIAFTNKTYHDVTIANQSVAVSGNSIGVVVSYYVDKKIVLVAPESTLIPPFHSPRGLIIALGNIFTNSLFFALLCIHHLILP